MNDVDRALVDKALFDFNALSHTEHDNLLSVLGVYGMYAIPTCHNMENLICNIARHHLLDQPQPFLELMKSGIPHTQHEAFWSFLTVPSINYLFEQQLPTTEKVVSVLVAEQEHLRQDEQNCFYFLRQFVDRLDQEELTAFLQFVTGSSVMPARISVIFNVLAGVMRRPIAHTCSNTLEISSTYSSLQEFKRELSSVLRDPLSFITDMP